MERRLQQSIASEILLITSSSAKISRNKREMVSMEILSMERDAYIIYTSYINRSKTYIVLMYINDDVKNKHNDVKYY